MKLLSSPFILGTLLALTLVKGIIWIGVTPAWQAPDEQNHFSLIQFFAETGKISVDPTFDNTVSQELKKTTDLMNFDWSGTHPVWRPQFSSTSIGPHEEEIKQIPKEERKVFIFQASGRKNPPLYYFLASLIYRIFSPFDILGRFFLLRLFGILIGVLTVLFTYLLVRTISPTQPLLALSTASILSFHPSFNFLIATVSVDLMATFITTLFLYLGVKFLVDKKLNFQKSFNLIVVSLASLITKTSLVPLVFIGSVVVFIRLLKFKTFPFNTALPLFFLIFFLVGFYILFSPSFGFVKDLIPFFSQVGQTLFIPSLIEFSKSAIPHYNGQVFAWYWGVFGWLEISLPIYLYRVLKVLTVVSIAGLFIFTLRRFKDKNFKKRDIVVFLLTTLLFLHGATIFFDWQTFARTGNLFGLQGRHFLMPISLHMLLLALGSIVLFPALWQRRILFLLVCFFIFLNIVSLIEIVRYFYPAQNFSLLALYLSQYKPIFLKAPFLAGFSFVSIFLLGTFLFQMGVNLLGVKKHNEIS